MRDTSRSRTKAPESMRDLPLGLKGHYYEDRVPDTLDLAERAKLGLNYLTELIDEEPRL